MQFFLHVQASHEEYTRSHVALVTCTEQDVREWLARSNDLQAAMKKYPHEIWAHEYWEPAEPRTQYLGALPEIQTQSVYQGEQFADWLDGASHPFLLPTSMEDLPWELIPVEGQTYRLTEAGIAWHALVQHTDVHLETDSLPWRFVKYIAKEQQKAKGPQKCA